MTNVNLFYSKYKDYFGWAIFLLVLLVLNFSYYLDSDEGVVLAGAWNLFNGRHIYSDFFEFIPPGSFYFVLLIWKIFFPNYLLTKLLSVLMIFFAAIGVYKIAKIFTDNKYLLIAPALFLCTSFNWQAINHNTYNIFFIIWSAFFFVRAEKKNNKIDFVLSGLILGISFLFLQQKSLIVLLICALWLLFNFLVKKNNIYLQFILFFIGSCLSATALLLFFAPIKVLYESLVMFPFFNYTETNSLPLNTWIFFLIITTASFLTLLIKKKTNSIYFLFILQMSLLLSSLPRPDILHITIVLFPLLAIIPTLLQIINQEQKYKKIFFLPCFLIILLLPFLTFIKVVNYPPFRFLNKNEATNYLEDECRQSQYIYAGPFLPGFYFLTKKLQPTPYSVLITNAHTKQQFLTAAEHLKTNRPQCAIMDYRMVEKFKYSTDNPVDQFIFSNYRQTKRYGSLLIYKIKE